MKSLVVEKPGVFAIREISIPRLSAYEALVKIEVCGICASTDWKILDGTLPYVKDYPCCLGHESVGTVIETGDKVKKFKTGDRVTRACAIWPGEQQDGIYSGFGGMSEYGIVRDREALLADGFLEYEDDYFANRQLVISQSISAVEASLAISLAETASWLQQAVTDTNGTIVVLGAGFAGLSMTMFLKQMGIERIIVAALSPTLSAAAEAGAHFTVALEAEADPLMTIKELTDGQGAKYVLECVGHQEVFNLGLASLAEDGLMACYGVPKNNIYELDINLSPGIMGLRWFATKEQSVMDWVCKLIENKNIDTSLFISHKWQFNDFKQALAKAHTGTIRKGFLIL